MCHQGSGRITCHFWCMSGRSPCDSKRAIADLITTQCKGRRGRGPEAHGLSENIPGRSLYCSIFFFFFFKSRRKPFFQKLPS